MAVMKNLEIMQFCRRYLQLQSGVEIRPSELKILAVMCGGMGPHTPAQLAMQLNVSRPMISATISRMVAAGIIVRVPSPDDGRSVCLMPTKHGVQIMKQVNKNTAQIMNTLTQRMGQKKLDTFIKLIGAVNSVLSAE